jgi:hypothetical protein
VAQSGSENDGRAYLDRLVDECFSTAPPTPTDIDRVVAAAHACVGQGEYLTAAAWYEAAARRSPQQLGWTRRLTAVELALAGGAPLLALDLSDGLIEAASGLGDDTARVAVYRALALLELGRPTDAESAALLAVDLAAQHTELRRMAEKLLGVARGHLATHDESLLRAASIELAAVLGRRRRHSRALPDARSRVADIAHMVAADSARVVAASERFDIDVARAAAARAVISTIVTGRPVGHSSAMESLLETGKGEGWCRLALAAIRSDDEDLLSLADTVRATDPALATLALTCAARLSDDSTLIDRALRSAASMASAAADRSMWALVTTALQEQSIESALGDGDDEGAARLVARSVLDPTFSNGEVDTMSTSVEIHRVAAWMGHTHLWVAHVNGNDASVVFHAAAEARSVLRQWRSSVGLDELDRRTVQTIVESGELAPNRDGTTLDQLSALFVPASLSDPASAGTEVWWMPDVVCRVVPFGILRSHGEPLSKRYTIRTMTAGVQQTSEASHRSREVPREVLVTCALAPDEAGRVPGSAGWTSVSSAGELLRAVAEHATAGGSRAWVHVGHAIRTPPWRGELAMPDGSRISADVLERLPLEGLDVAAVIGCLSEGPDLGGRSGAPSTIPDALLAAGVDTVVSSIWWVDMANEVIHRLVEAAATRVDIARTVSEWQAAAIAEPWGAFDVGTLVVRDRAVS